MTGSKKDIKRMPIIEMDFANGTKKPVITASFENNITNYFLFDKFLIWKSKCRDLDMLLSALVNKETSTPPKVSIIVPCYNTAEYLEECLLSLINQSLKEIEIIIIDDGSTDHSLITAKIFAKYDNRIKIITQENAGPSKARNEGLKIAKGEYISFIDSDDWIDKNYIEKLYTEAKKNNCDISIATIIRKRKFTQKYRVDYTEQKIYETLGDKIKACNIPTCCYIWNKLYKRDLIKNANFKEGSFYEDVLWLPEIIKRANKIVTVPNVNYYYRVNNNSIVKKLPSTKKQEDAYNAKKYIKKFFEENNLPLAKKHKIITRHIKYFANIPILKIKENKNRSTHYLLGFIPIFSEKIDANFLFVKTKKIFFYKELDSHIYLNLFGLHFSFKKTKNFTYKEANEFGLTEIKRNPQIIVSLTSFPARINIVHKAINCLLRQTLKPDKLILWLGYNQFPQKEEDLPETLLKLKEYGLEIRWCEDLKSYKKLIPTLKEYPNDIIVTADDDLYYQEDWLESLHNEYLKNPENIYTRRATGIFKIGNFFRIIPHYDNTNFRACYNNQIMGGAGTLYPPNSLNKDILNVEKIKNLIPTYDDIYFWAMAITNNTKIGLVKNNDLNLYTIENSQTTALCKINGNNSEMSDIDAFRIIFKEYPDIIEKLRNKKE